MDSFSNSIPLDHRLPLGDRQGVSGKRKRWIVALLIIVPLWMVVSGGIGLWLHFRQQKIDERTQQMRLVKDVSASSLLDDVSKLSQTLGERNTSTPETRESLKRAAALIQGGVGPSNMGYKIQQKPDPAGTPLIWIEVYGKKDEQALWVITPYDSPVGNAGVERNATGVAATMAVAQAVADAKPAHPIKFLFLPHGTDAKGPWKDVAEKTVQLIREQHGAAQILWVESMGTATELRLSGNDTPALTSALASLGKRSADEARESDPVEVLQAAGLPIARITTLVPGPGAGEGTALPDAERLAATTGRLVELVQRLAGIASAR